jgi:hypothetical protein
MRRIPGTFPGLEDMIDIISGDTEKYPALFDLLYCR